MSFLSNIGKSLLNKVAANTVNRFNSLLNSYSYTTYDNMAKVTLNVSDGSSGVSYETDILQRMANIEWSRGYSWDVHISPEPPAPFNDKRYGLPAVEVQSDFSLMGESVDLPLACSTYKAPVRKNFFDIKLTLLDSYNGVLEQYFADWMNKIYSWDGSSGLGGRINYLDQSVRTIAITKLTSTKRAIFTRRYLVYPEANMSSFDNSTGAVRNFTVNLVVAGYLGQENSQGLSTGSNIPATEYGTLTDAIKSTTTPTPVGSTRWNSYASDSTLSIMNSQNMRGDSVLMQTLKGTSGTFYGGGASSNLPGTIF